jgi:hypothetical protein
MRVRATIVITALAVAWLALAGGGARTVLCPDARVGIAVRLARPAGKRP